MASQTIARILSAEQSAAETVSRAEADAEKRTGTAARQAQQYMEDEAARTAAAVAAIAQEAREKIAQINGEAERNARAKAQAIRQEALRRAGEAEDLVISIIIPE